MWQQLVDPAVHVRGQSCQHIFEVGMRVMAVELGRLDQAHHRRRSLACAQRARKQVFWAYRYRPDLQSAVRMVISKRMHLFTTTDIFIKCRHGHNAFQPCR